MSKVVRFGANLKAPMTIGEGLNEIERMRRQMNRFEHLPTNGGPLPDPALFAEARSILNRVEANLRGSMTGPPNPS